MKEYFSHTRICRNCLRFIALLWLLLVPALSAASNSVLIIKSSDNHYFSTSIEQVVNRISGKTGFNITTVGSAQLDQLTTDKFDLIITLGALAASYSVKFGQEIPVIRSYITSFQLQHLDQYQNNYTLLMEQPLARYVRFVQLLISPQRIAIVQPEQTKISPERIQALQDTYRLSIDQSLFREGDNPVKTVRSLLLKNDALLSLPAPQVYNKKSLKGILLSSYRQRKPVISYSPSHVRSGALASIYTSPTDIGRQIARLANQILQSRPPGQRLFHASDFNISVNQQVARSLGISLPDTDDIIRQLNQAAQP